ncbi:NLRC3 [Symbiodinium natans]|uniref:NLRC3 protein n=1 Tax=Symbiodinium natans TaxID=878477 RepID=A0A812L148_9DINO|nr:NLRC3 [Symbiodinium natans]
MCLPQPPALSSPMEVHGTCRGGAPVSGSRFRIEPGAGSVPETLRGKPRTTVDSDRNSSPAEPYPAPNILDTLLDGKMQIDSADYGRFSAVPGARPVARASQADRHDGNDGHEGPSQPKRTAASQRPEWDSLFDDLDDGEYKADPVAEADPQSESWRAGSAVGPDWDHLYKRLPAAARGDGAETRLDDDKLDYAALFSGATDPDDDDLPDLVATSAANDTDQRAARPDHSGSRSGELSTSGAARQEARDDKRSNAEEIEDEEELNVAQRRLVFDLDSSLVDLACHWQKYGILGHFNLSGHADEGVEAWGEKLLPKGTLSLADFRSHGVELDLSDTHAVSSGFQELEEFSSAVKRDGTVTTLRLSRAKIGNSGASWIAGALMRNFTLTELVLSSNSISDEGVDPLAAVLDSNNTLKKIDLSDNRVGSRGAQQLASASSRSRSLTDLDLSRNSIGDQGAEEFLSVLDVAVRPRPAALRILDFSGNSITRRTEERLLSAFHRGITVLDSLRLSDSDKAQAPSADAGKPPRFTVICTQQGIEIRAGRAGPRAQVSWEQDQGDVEVVLKRPEMRKCDAAVVDVAFGYRRLKVTVRAELICDIELFARIRPEDCAWTVGDGYLQIVLAKAEIGRWQSLTA